MGQHDLDELVYDVLAERAAAGNNDGIAAQLAFLVGECQDEAALRDWLADVLPGRTAGDDGTGEDGAVWLAEAR